MTKTHISNKLHFVLKNLNVSKIGKNRGWFANLQ